MCIRVCARVHVSKPARVCACILVCVQCSLDIRNPHRRTEKSVLMSFSAHRIIPCPLSFFFFIIHPFILCFFPLPSHFDYEIRGRKENTEGVGHAMNLLTDVLRCMTEEEMK